MIAAAPVIYLEGYLFDRPEAKEAFRTGRRHRRQGRPQDGADAVGRVLRRPPPRRIPRAHRSRRRHPVRQREARSPRSTRRTRSTRRSPPCAATCEIAVLTRSAKGSLIVTAKADDRDSAEPVAKVVDTTGAGDLYAAGFLYGFTHGLSLEDCGRLGSLAAAEVIGHIGARPELPLDTARAQQKGLISLSCIRQQRRSCRIAVVSARYTSFGCIFATITGRLRRLASTRHLFSLEAHCRINTILIMRIRGHEDRLHADHDRRYGRPKGSGLDDSQQLASHCRAARRQPEAEADHRHPLARRRRSVRPSAACATSSASSRRKLLADAPPRSASPALARAPGADAARLAAEHRASEPAHPAVDAAARAETIAADAANASPQPPLLVDWFDLGLWARRHRRSSSQAVAGPALAAPASGRDGAAGSARAQRDRDRACARARANRTEALLH